MSAGRVTMQIQNSLAELSRVSAAVEAFCEEHGARECSFPINVALEELLVNTISYGYTDNESHDIDVTLTIGDGAIVAELRDDAAPFDPLQAPPPDHLDAPIEERRIGGLGIHLMKSVMDQITYDYRDGRNHITLLKRLASAVDEPAEALKR